MRKSKCRGCGAEIYWAKTEGLKPIPLDPPKKLYVKIRKAGNDMIVKMLDTYMPHHATCPEVEKFRR